MRLKKVFTSSMFLITIIFYFDNIKAVYPAETVILKTFTFYEIGSKDINESAIKKLKKNNFRCFNAKSIDLDTSGIPLNKLYNKTPESLDKICELDKSLHHWGIGTKYNKMKIDVLDCEPMEPSIFQEVTLYFSNLNKKLLSLHLIFKDYDLMKKKIIDKHGRSIAKDYWQKNNDMLLMYELFENWHLIIFYENNIVDHYKIIEAEIKVQKIQKEKKLENVF